MIDEDVDYRILFDLKKNIMIELLNQELARNFPAVLNLYQMLSDLVMLDPSLADNFLDLHRTVISRGETVQTKFSNLIRMALIEGQQ